MDAVTGDQERAIEACRRAWADAEREGPAPQYVRDIITLDYADVAAQILSADEAAIRNLVNALYAGDAIVMRGAFDKAFFDGLIQRLHGFARAEPPSFHKMLAGTPDFHRIIDQDMTKSYAVTAVRHGFYFYRWNGDPVGAFGPVTERWRVLKILSGLQPEAFEANKPEDGVIDRLVFYQYPRGCGGLKSHVDPTNHHCIVMGAIMSERGRDFTAGGFFAVGPNGSHVDLEPCLKVGDFLIIYPTVEHGVDTVDPGAETVWDTADGRWFMGLSSVDSDHAAVRQTAERRE